MVLRIYLGELDDDFIEVPITPEQWQKLKDAGKAAIDDGGIRFMEAPLHYPPTYNDSQSNPS